MTVKSIYFVVNAMCKRTQHRWPTTANIVGGYVFCLCAHPVACCCVLLGAVELSLKPVKLLATCKWTEQLPTMLGDAGQQCCVCLHGA